MSIIEKCTHMYRQIGSELHLLDNQEETHFLHTTGGFSIRFLLPLLGHLWPLLPTV
jgi:hypothetical protein